MTIEALENLPKEVSQAVGSMVSDLRQATKVRAALAERLGRLSACVYIKEYLEDNGSPPLPLELRDQLISYCNEPTEHLTNDELNGVYSND